MAIRKATAIERLKAGETILRTLPRGDRAGDAPRACLSGGGVITEATYAALTDPDAPMVQPVSPGLLPDSEPQEWGWIDG